MFINIPEMEQHENTSSSSSTDSLENQPSFVIDMSNTDIYIENIQVEDNLISYTDNHFMNKANIDLQRIRNLDEKMVSLHISDEELYNQIYRNCDSPITIRGSPPESVYGSNYGSCENSDVEEEPIAKPKKKIAPKEPNPYKKIEYQEFEQSIDKYYDIDTENKLFCEIDIITTYIKGQKNIFIQSKQLSQWQLNCLTIPSLLITAFLSIGTAFIPKEINVMVISVLNGFIALLISLRNYLNLESYTEMYLQLANQYDKMETMLDMTNRSLLFIENETEKKQLVITKIKEIEQKIDELKENNNTIIPAEIISLFPIICHINIFSFINKMETQKKEIIVKLKNIKNEIRYILHKWEKEENNNKKEIRLKEQRRIHFLIDIKNKLKMELSDYQNVYSHIDDLFTREIKRSEKKMNKWGIFYLCFWRITPTKISYKGVNPVLDKYFQHISIDE